MTDAWHRLSEVDLAAATAVCSRCGPTRIRIRRGHRGHQCWTIVEEYRAKRYGSVEARRWRRHKITASEYADLLTAQGGACAICRREAEVLWVDHDHACCPGDTTCGGCRRGLLCPACNSGLGLFQDDVDRLRGAIAYLEPRSVGG